MPRYSRHVSVHPRSMGCNSTLQQTSCVPRSAKLMQPVMGNHRETIGKPYRNGGLMGYEWDLPSGDVNSLRTGK